MIDAIGVFDSGVGGLTVVSALRRRLPRESILYLGDTARVPYGSKSPETVSRYRGYLAQYKYNDIRLLISVAGDGSISLTTRKRQPLKSFEVDESLRRQFSRLRTKRGKIYLLDGGVLRSAYGPGAARLPARRDPRFRAAQ